MSLTAAAHYPLSHPHHHQHHHFPPQNISGAALPTPPSSPYAPYHVESTISLLESLTAFYHEERMWVYRTRASLELMVQGKSFIPDLGTSDDIVASSSTDPTISASPSSSSSTGPISESLSSTTTTIAADEDDTHHMDMGVKQEPHSPSMNSPGQSKWMQRKKSYRLKLEGLSFTRVVGGRVSKDRANGSMVQRKQQRDSGVQILELFEKMMQARMESCERVTKMVRNANACGMSGTANVNIMGSGRVNVRVM
ncbi:hypothetical protein SERLA73DRAFT_190121 [Serpula lacrymans var. lacrymans S7.3]|uniref:Uncharacterized protein n=2 Tax=Serpula lacrymans var. lacrymans TaxID=341189 RepID=F8QF40_SERL3|nr:uncharacterized protein SERLADRAFT_461954 [Serpula lacrymans var. lacrymans S7.9]EGN92999.1 hypothetical protein SERLA73DRAFT_190121 [Serpula lacrymans var. lacrymans S7.3]EGO27832.1 hypothetical protein SERLADRAFT_461954 [Serpula lacrymans var. lacrymans S7.9]